MNTRISAALLALAVLLLSAFPAFAEGGNGDGSGDGGGRETPLTLTSSSVPNGAENVDPNVRIVLTFSKNVVHFNVKEHNMQCFSVTDSKGNEAAIRVEMGDDQVDPDIKRIVTIVPVSPYRAGETYLLTVKAGLTAKNEENVLEKNVYLSFTIQQASSQTQYIAPTPATRATTTARNTTTTTTTTTTKAAAESTTKRATTTRPPITAATRSATTAASTKTSTTTAASTMSAASTAKQVVTVTAAIAPAYSTTVMAVSVALPVSESETETLTEAAAQTEPEATSDAQMQTDAPAQETAPSAPQAETTPSDRRVSPAIFIGIGIALAGTAGAVFAIQKAKKKG